MSEENVEIARRAFAAVHSDDPDAFRQYFPEDCIWHPVREWPDAPESLTGHQGIIDAMTMWRKSFDDYTAVLHDVRDAGDRVVCLGEQIGRITGSDGPPIRQLFGFVCSDFRDGKIGEIRFFLDRAEALEAAGLSE